MNALSIAMEPSDNVYLVSQTRLPSVMASPPMSPPLSSLVKHNGLEIQASTNYPASPNISSSRVANKDSSKPFVVESLNNGSVVSGLAKKIHNNAASNLQRRIMLSNLPRRSTVDIEFNNVSYSVSEGRRKGYKTIIKSVSGRFRSGELTAIMGPSGAGKSTLMNILAGFRSSQVTGTITVNNRERDLRKFRKMSCYIMQEDQLSPYLTAYEAMMVSANLKLGSIVSLAEKQAVVDEIMATLSLDDSKHTFTKNLSGGQRKRLAVALELVNNPPVMFFDEPTSGLDSSSSMQCLTLLKALAQGGRTVICTIHQPSARLFEKFDRLYLLAEGQAIYRGSISGLVPFLGSMGLECPSYHNPADFVMEVASGEYGEVLPKLVVAVENGKCNNWNCDVDDHGGLCTEPDETLEKELAKEANGIELVTVKAKQVKKGDSQNTGSNVEPGHVTVNCETGLLDSEENLDSRCNSFPSTCWAQFCILLHRTFISIWRDQMLTRLRLVSHLIVGVLIGLLYWDIGNDASKVFSNAGSLFFTQLFLMFTAMMPTVLTFPLEMNVLTREHLNYWYTLKAYYLAKTIADLPFQIIFPALYVVIVYFMTGQPLDVCRFFMFLNICVMTSLVAQSLGLVIGAAAEIQTAIFLGPISSIPLLLFSGFFVTFQTIPAYLRWLSYVSYIRYGFEGSLLSTYAFDRPSLHCSVAYCHYKDPVKLLEDLDVVDSHYWVDFLVLLGYFFVLRFIAFLILKWKLRSQR